MRIPVKAIVALLTSLLPGSPLFAGPLPPQYHGYFWMESTAYGQYKDYRTLSDGTMTYDYNNVIMIDPWVQPDPKRAVIDCINLGYTVVIEMGTKFGYDSYRDRYGVDQTISSPAARQAHWNSLFNEVYAAIQGYEDKILGIYLVDEPDGGIITQWNIRSRQEELITAAKNYFNGTTRPKVKVFMNYCWAWRTVYDPATGQYESVIARNNDLVSFDWYVNGGTTTTTKAVFDTEVDKQVNAIKAQLGSQIDIFVCGSSFRWTPDFTNFPDQTQQSWYWERVCNDPQLVGLWWFTFPDQAAPTALGAVSSAPTLAQHAIYGKKTVAQRPSQVRQRFDGYANQAAFQADFAGPVWPTLSSAVDMGSNSGGKSLVFDKGGIDSSKAVFNRNRTGSVSAFLYDVTFHEANSGFGLKIMNQNGTALKIYTRASDTNYMITDEANSATIDSGIPSLPHWQKVEAVFKGTGVDVYIDSLKVYSAAWNWTGGFSKVGFMDPTTHAHNTLVGVIDNLEVNPRRYHVRNDFDGDGRSDMPAYRSSGSTWRWAQSKTNFRKIKSVSWSSSTFSPQITGDFDGDGMSEMVHYDASGPNWYINLSSNGYTGSWGFTFGAAGDIPITGDWDGDGRADIGRYVPSTGVWQYKGSLPFYSTVTSLGTLGGTSGDVPLCGDYDGDGKSDMCIYRPSTGTWMLRLSTQNYTAVTNYTLGDSTSTPVIGDFDGDGITDLVVYKESNAVWTCKKSSQGFATSVTLGAFGGPGLKPVPGDYDGDGITDFGAYWSANALFYIRESGRGQDITISLGNSGDSVPGRPQNGL